jgi:hypothetical protein
VLGLLVKGFTNNRLETGQIVRPPLEELIVADGVVS